MDIKPMSNDDQTLARMKATATERMHALKEDLKLAGIPGLAVVAGAPILKVAAAAAALSQVSPMVDSHIVTISDMVSSYGVAAAGVAATMSAVALAHYLPQVKQWAFEAINGAAKFFRREEVKAGLFGGLARNKAQDSATLPLTAGDDAIYEQMDNAGVLVDHNGNTVEYKRGDVRIESGDKVMIVAPDVANVMLDLEEKVSGRMTGDRFGSVSSQKNDSFTSMGY